jgi:VWFA-related protein
MSGFPISCLIFALTAVSVPAQTTVSLAARPAPSAGKLPPSDFRVDAHMVQIPVTVTDVLDRNVMNLTARNFRIFDGEVEERISSFSMTDAPISTGIVFDTSGSMKRRIQDSRAAVKQFLATAVPDDEFSLVQFADTATLLSGFTRNPAEIERPLGSMAAHGWTALYDAMFLSMHQVRRAANPRRVLLVLSDGEDNNSRYTESEMMSLVREGDVTVYAIGLFTRARGLEKMAEETGGRMITVHSLSELPAAMEKLSREIRNQYMLGYFPSRAGNDGRYRKVRVEVNLPAGAPPVRASWRRGYFVPDN